MRILTAVALIMALSGCSLLGKANCAPTKVWTKPGVTDSAALQKEFFFDKFVCIQQSQFSDPNTPAGINWTSFNECMKAFGFVPAQ